MIIIILQKQSFWETNRLKSQFALSISMKVLTFHFRSNLSFDEVMEKAEAREKQYMNVPGMNQIVYMKDERTDQYGSILFFDDEEDLNEFRVSNLARTLKEVYQSVGPPEIRIFDVIKKLSTSDV